MNDETIVFSDSFTIFALSVIKCKEKKSTICQSKGSQRVESFELIYCRKK